MFRVGQKVVCVDASKIAHDEFGRDVDTRDIVEGGIYTIRWVGEYEGVACVRLVGVFRYHSPIGTIIRGIDCPFRASRFRPIVSRPTSIEFAHEILRSVSAPTKEHAHV